MRDKARSEYEKWDRMALYADVQREMARSLLKLRVTFEENSSADAGYFVNFKLCDANNKGTVIILQGAENCNETTGKWLGCAAVKAQHLQQNVKGLTVHTVRVEDWRKASREERLSMLYELSVGTQKKQMYA